MLSWIRAGVSVRSGVVGAAVLVSFWSSFATAQTVTEFRIPTAASRPGGITTGPDGAIWFVETSGNKIGRITTEGVITEYPIPTPNSAPQYIVSGPDGALWFVEGSGNKIGRITTAGVITEFANFANDWPQSLAVGPDGALWIASQGPMGRGAASGDGWIGRITTAGVLNRFPLPRHNVQANFIAAGSDGALWFGTDNTIDRITTAGVITEFALPTPTSGAFGITAGPDGALWFAEPFSNKIGRITTAGVITEFALPTAGSGPLAIATGADGALWFTEVIPAANGDVSFTGNRIGRITTSGAISEFTLPNAASGPGFIAAGPDGAMWFGETANRIGRITVPVRVLADCLFNWAERTYPTLFAPTTTSNTLAPYYYRYYSQTRAYLATSSADNHVYYLGPISNNAILDVGALSTWLGTASCQ
jgi:virginiamycin B lyase